MPEDSIPMNEYPVPSYPTPPAEDEEEAAGLVVPGDEDDDEDNDGEAPRRRGRPRVEIDFKKLEALCQIHATDEEMAMHFNCSVKTIERLKRNPDYAPVFSKGRADGKISLRRAQFQEALKGNTALLIWLGKQFLNQADKVESDVKLGGAVKIEDARKSLDGLSDADFAALAKENGIDLPTAA